MDGMAYTDTRDKERKKEQWLLGVCRIIRKGTGRRPDATRGSGFLVKDLGPVVQRPISPNPGLNFNPGLFISFFKSLFGKIFTILFRTSNDQIASKNI